MADHVDQTQTTPANPTSPAKVKDKHQPLPNADLEAEIATEVEHGQLTDDELNSGNDI